jgi:hypothetical protein
VEPQFRRVALGDILGQEPIKLLRIDRLLKDLYAYSEE